MDALEAYCEAVEARTEAERMAELAARLGTPEEQRAVAFALETARMAVENAQARVGGEFVQMFRCALSACEPGLNAVLERLMSTAAAQRSELWERQTEEAWMWAVREIDRLKAENWDIAREVVRLARRVEALEYEREVQDNDTAECPRGREPAGVG